MRCLFACTHIQKIMLTIIIQTLIIGLSFTLPVMAVCYWWLKRQQKKPTKSVIYFNHNQHVDWNLELLMSLEWKRYEEICKEFLQIRENGRFKVNVTKTGADGGIDLTLTNNQKRIVGIGQCKAWNGIIGVSLIRELYGVMASEKVENGYFFTTSKFSNDAIEFAKNKKIELINGKQQIKIIQSFTQRQQSYLHQIATNGDYTTPTCPNCDIKMLKRKGKDRDFWGCSNYPRCRNTLQIRKTNTT